MDNMWRTLIERAKNNDQDAFYELYQNSYNAVYRTVKSMIKDEDTSLDIVQDTFIKGFESLSTLENPDNYLAWMKRISANKAKDWFKKKHEISFSQLSDDEESEPDFEDERLEHSPEAFIDQKETARLIDEILSTLSDEQRIAIGMHLYQGMSASEIARELDINENTVKSRLNYGKKKIKASVEELAKKGTQLYSLAPIPFLIWLFRNQMLHLTVGDAPAAAFGSIMSKLAVQSTAAAVSGGAAVVSGSTQAGAAAAQVGAAAAGKVGAGLFASIGAKIAAAVISVTIISGIGTGIYFVTRDSDSKNETPVISAATPSKAEPSATQAAPPETEVPNETSTPIVNNKSAEELLTLFLEEDLISEKGIYNINQYSYYGVVGSNGLVCRTDTVYNTVTDEIRQYTTYIAEEAPEYVAAKENTDNSGLYYGDIYDYDGDGEPELLTVYGDNGSVYLELFDTDSNKVISAGKLPLEDLNLKYNWQWVGRSQAADGSSYIIICEVDMSVVSTYYRISNELNLISSLSIDSNSTVATETFYDGRAERTFNVELSSTENISVILKDYGESNVEQLCIFYEIGAEINDFIEKYYKTISTNTNNDDSSMAPTPAATNDPHTHVFSTARVIEHTTCTEAGMRTHTCYCGAHYDETIPETGHSYAKIDEKTSTSTSNGDTVNTTTITYACSSCNDSYTDTKTETVIPGHEHAYSTSRVTKHTTCTEAGTKRHTCYCGNSYTETVPATGHSYTGNIFAPTEYVRGYTLHTCYNCGTFYKDNYTFASLSE